MAIFIHHLNFCKKMHDNIMIKTKTLHLTRHIGDCPYLGPTKYVVLTYFIIFKLILNI